MGLDFNAQTDTEAAPLYQPPRVGKVQGVKQRANRPFLYFAHPNNWHIMGGKLVPQLAQKPLSGGLSGVESTKHGVDPKQMILAMQDRGYVLVPQDYDGTNYVGRTKTITGQWFYHPRWMRCVPGSERFTVDVDGFASFCEGMVNDLIPPPDDSLLEQLTEAAVSRHSEAEAKARRFPHLGPEAKRAAEEVALLMNYGQKAEPPKPRKRKPRKAPAPEVPDAS